MLQPGDTIRIGDTMFTFEMRNSQSGTQYSDGSTVFSNPPQPPVMPNPGGNTSYGMGNMYGSGQSGEGMTLSATSPSFTPPGNAYPDQQYSNPPPPPSHPSQPQVSGFVPPSNTPYGQGPLYTPSPPVYTPPTQARKRSPVLVIALAAAALVIIIGFLSFFLYQNNQNQLHAEATATAKTQMTTTALGHQNATATAFAGTNMTATAVVTSHFPPFTVLSFFDFFNSKNDSNWSAGSPCQTSTGGFQVSIAQANTIEYCTYIPATSVNLLFKLL